MHSAWWLSTRHRPADLRTRPFPCITVRSPKPRGTSAPDDALSPHSPYSALAVFLLQHIAEAAGHFPGASGKGRVPISRVTPIKGSPPIKDRVVHFSGPRTAAPSTKGRSASPLSPGPLLELALLSKVTPPLKKGDSIPIIVS